MGPFCYLCYFSSAGIITIIDIDIIDIPGIYRNYTEGDFFFDDFKNKQKSNDF